MRLNNMKKLLIIFITVSMVGWPFAVLGVDYSQSPSPASDPRYTGESGPSGPATNAPAPQQESGFGRSGWGEVDPQNAPAPQQESGFGRSGWGEVDPQAETAVIGVEPEESSGEVIAEGVGDIATSFAECSIGYLLAQGIRRAIGSLLGNFIETAVAKIPIVGGILQPNVPTEPVKQTKKETGTLSTGFVSWDAVAFCLVNSIIEYIAMSTVEWINSGFQGNPVFVENPERFFASIADIEAGILLDELTGGFLCSPLEAPIRISLAAGYNSRISPLSQRMACSFTEISGNLESFIAGDTYSFEDMISYGRPENNSLGLNTYLRIELNERIANQIGVQSKLLDWGQGVFSVKNEKGEIVSPGTFIEDQINKRIDHPTQRLLMADEFDEIVTALVNQLVRIAISEMTQVFES
jgi:hypothetical protein